MTRRIENVTIRIVPATHPTLGHPFTELFSEWDENGVHRHGYSRTFQVIDNTTYNRAAQIAALMKRMAA